MSMKNSNDTIGNQTHDLLACTAVPQPTAPPCTPYTEMSRIKIVYNISIRLCKIQSSDFVKYNEKYYFITLLNNTKGGKKTNKMQQSDVYYQHCLNMFWASLCPSSGEQDVCYCMWCAALVLLDVVGSGCGGLRCRVRAL